VCEIELRLEEIIYRVDEPMSLPRVKTKGCFWVALPSNGGRVVPHGPHSTDNLTLTSYFVASKWGIDDIYIYIYIKEKKKKEKKEKKEKEKEKKWKKKNRKNTYTRSASDPDQPSDFGE